MEELIKWSGIPVAARELIRKQYGEYRILVSNPELWEEWAKRQGYDIDE